MRVEVGVGTFKFKCPWCKTWPVVETHDESRFWAACISEDCPVNPVTFASDSVEGAVKLWNQRK